MNDTVSILLTTLNRGNLISHAIDSVLAQTYQDWELLISDDGSTDNTAAVVKKYLEKEPRIKYFFHKQMGISGSRNLVAQKASGESLAIIDSDDYYKPEHLQVHYEFMKKNKAEIVYSQVIVEGPEELAYVPDRHDLSQKIHIKDCVCSGTLLIRKSAFVKLKGFRIMPYAEDSDLVERARQMNMKVLKNNISTYVYNVQTPGSVAKSV